MSQRSSALSAIYPGSFDPITNGHLDILDRGLKIFPKITLLVAGTTQKTALFSPTERVALIRQVVKRRPGVTVDLWSGLSMDYARKHHAQAIIRGLRAASDFEYEFMMASMNRQIHAKVETVFIMSSQNLFFVSSSMIKELFRYGGDISPYVPSEVVRALKKTRNKS